MSEFLATVFATIGIGVTGGVVGCVIAYRIERRFK